jgi:hypothetical protein
VNALSPVYYISGLVLAVLLISSSLSAAEDYAALSYYHGAGEKTDTLVKEWFEGLSLGLYQGGSRKAETVSVLAERAAWHERRALLGGYALLGISVVFLVAVALARRAGQIRRRHLVAHLLGVSALFLVVGLAAPILTIAARDEVAVIGEVVLQYETRGILTTVLKLFSTGNHFLGVLLLIFSVVAPTAKLMLSLGALLARSRSARRLTAGTVELIGRWSMTDVFVVAVLLAYLVAETSQVTDASVGPGLYFFAGYGVLSLLAGHLLTGRRGKRIAES